MAQDSAKSAATVCDPVTLQIVRGALRAIQGEMEAVIERTAMSPFIREKKDFYVALFDGAGRLIVGSSLPLSGDVVGPIVEHYPLRHHAAGRHLLVQRLLRLQGARSRTRTTRYSSRPGVRRRQACRLRPDWAHFNDIGGMRAGSMSPDAPRSSRKASSCRPCGWRARA